MKKNNMKIKDITLVDQIMAIEMIVDSYFTNGHYTPYYAERSTIFAIVDNFIEGVEFDDEDDIFECAKNDKELHELVDKFLTPHKTEKDKKGNEKVVEYNEYYDIMDFVYRTVFDMVQFEKEKFIHNTGDMQKIVEFCDFMIDGLTNLFDIFSNRLTPEQVNDVSIMMKKMANSNMTREDIIDIIKDSSSFDMDKAMEEIVDAKNEQINEKDKRIRELENKLSELRRCKEKNESRNVLEDK